MVKGVPEGWEVVKVSEVASLFRGRSYRGEDLADDGGLPFLNLKCIDRDGGFRHDGLKRYRGIHKDTQTARAGDIIMAVTDMTQERRIVARAARVPKTDEDLFVMSMDLIKVSPNADIPKAYLYAMLRFSNFPDEVKQHANGVNVLHLNPERIAKFEFALPPPLLRTQLGETCSNIYEQCDLLNRKNANLRLTRDLLLPRLVSGEVEVSEVSTDEQRINGY
jgi:type I restriction enzyme S subunit